MRRSHALRKGGVATPAAKPGPTVRDVRFARVDGHTGLVLAQTDFVHLFKPLAQVHTCRVSGLQRFEPFLRIRPRLHLTQAGPVRAVLDGPIPAGTATLHGDLHLGQFIRDRDGKVWIVDLGDMAVGPSEADMANSTVHLGTTLDGCVRDWADRVKDAWHRVGQPCDGARFQRLLRIALVRCHLKLREAGRPDWEAEVLGYLRDSSNFSIL